MNFFKKVFTSQIAKTLAHAALGGAVSALAPAVIHVIPMIPHIDPVTAAVLGSIATSAFSAHKSAKDNNE